MNERNHEPNCGIFDPKADRECDCGAEEAIKADRMLDAAIYSAKDAAGLDPELKHLPMMFVDYLIEAEQKAFWERHVDRALVDLLESGVKA